MHTDKVFIVNNKMFHTTFGMHNLITIFTSLCKKSGCVSKEKPLQTVALWQVSHLVLVCYTLSECVSII